MKSMWPPLVAIFFMTYLYRAGGTMAPSAPPGSATAMTQGNTLSRLFFTLWTKYLTQTLIRSIYMYVAESLYNFIANAAGNPPPYSAHKMK